VDVAYSFVGPLLTIVWQDTDNSLEMVSESVSVSTVYRSTIHAGYDDVKCHMKG
jgi:hypothetical protein